MAEVRAACADGGGCRCDRLKAMTASEVAPVTTAPGPRPADPLPDPNGMALWLIAPPEALLTTAHHEAAHALAALIFDGGFISCTAALDPAGRARTVCHPVSVHPLDTELGARTALAKRCVIFAAGWAMDQRRRVPDWRPSKVDLGEIDRVARVLWEGCIRTTMVERLHVVARELIAVGERAIGRLAWEGLLAEPYWIDGQRAHALVGRDLPSLRVLVAGETESIARTRVVRG